MALQVFIILAVAAGFFFLGRLTAPRKLKDEYVAIAENRYKNKSGLMEAVKRQ